MPNPENTVQVAAQRARENYLDTCGLALAGANTTIADWKRGEAPPIQEDGILTAEDVSTRDLKGTWLVTLSACDTGSGEARAGEGVMGLRRGFIEAGAQNLLMTLWPISDEFAIQIMSDFYEAAHTARSSVNVNFYQMFDPVNDTENRFVVRINPKGMLNVSILNVRHCAIRCS
ncbi:MAG TPA: CHAT domain-containing protein [Chthoniobacterales bacterium]|nr:CHAT domain-containing protein [Chthoniobacterales bacterium]